MDVGCEKKFIWDISWNLEFALDLFQSLFIWKKAPKNDIKWIIASESNHFQGKKTGCN